MTEILTNCFNRNKKEYFRVRKENKERNRNRKMLEIG